MERDLDRQGGEPIMGGLGCIFWPFELEAGDRLRRPGQLRVLRARSASSARSADGLASHRFADVTIDKFTDSQTFIEWAAETIPGSFWAGAYYRSQRDKGCSHQVVAIGKPAHLRRIHVPQCTEPPWLAHCSIQSRRRLKMFDGQPQGMSWAFLASSALLREGCLRLLWQINENKVRLGYK